MKTEKEIREKLDELLQKIQSLEGDYSYMAEIQRNDAWSFRYALFWVLGESSEKSRQNIQINT